MQTILMTQTKNSSIQMILLKMKISKNLTQTLKTRNSLVTQRKKVVMQAVQSEFVAQMRSLMQRLIDTFSETKT